MAGRTNEVARLLALAAGVPDLPAPFLEFLETAVSLPKHTIEEMVDTHLIDRLVAEVGADGELSCTGKTIDELIGKLMLIAMSKEEATQ